MNINRALIDRALDAPVNDEAVMMYHRLITLIDKYNTYATDKGLPIKNITSYNTRMNCTLLSRLMTCVLKDIDRVKRIKEDREEKILKNVTFRADGTVRKGIWQYTLQDDNSIEVGLNPEADPNTFTEESITLDYSYMPYEKLIDTNGHEYLTVSYNSLFYGLPSSIKILTIDNWTNRDVTDMSSMFQGCSALTSLALNNFDTSKVTDMSSMFSGCSALTSLTLGDNFNTANVENMEAMFYNCSALTSLTLGDNFNTSKVTNMSGMFNECSSLISLTLNNFDTSKVTIMSYMFQGCSALTSLALNNFDTSKVTNMSFMFWNCSALTSLALNNFDTSNATNVDGMFADCSALETLSLGSKFDVSDIIEIAYINHIFIDCYSLTSVSLYKTSNSIIKWLPSATWNITNSASNNVGEVTIAQGPSATWSPTNLPDSWEDNTQWTLSRTIPSQ